jgi:signal transduction histidine kinase
MWRQYGEVPAPAISPSRRAARMATPGGGGGVSLDQTLPTRGAGRGPRTPKRESTARSARDNVRAARAASFLAEASRLLAESAGYEETLLAVTELALPHLGSWCIVDLVEPDGSPRRVRILHPDPERQVHARRLETSWPPERNDPLGAPRVVQTRRTEMISEVTDDLLVAVARSEENLRDLRALSIGSVLTVPLIARDEVLGAVTYVSATAEEPYDESDVALAEDLASRCAVALHNARLRSLAEEARATSAEMNERLVVASLRDHDLADAARRANEAKSRFLSAMSHEFRSPLGAIGLYATLVERLGPVTAGQLDHLRKIEAAIQHLARLLSDVLDLAKVEADSIEIDSHPAAPTDVIAQAISMVAPEAAVAGVGLSAPSSSTTSLRYEGDADRVRQILLNLLSNAVHFSPRGASVTVTCGDSAAPPPEARLSGGGPWVFMAVEDDGPGIAPEEAEMLFEPFTQGKAGRAWRGQDGGTGLGLAISRQLARRMNGDITLRSTEGEGSTFTLWLPAAGGPAR